MSEDWETTDDDLCAPADLEPSTATLGRTRINPALALRFDRRSVHPVTGVPLTTWVKALPDRRWEKERGRWLVTGTGAGPTALLEAAGFAIDLTSGVRDPELKGLKRLEQLVRPIAVMDGPNAIVYPRFGGYQSGLRLMPAGATWSKDHRAWSAYPPDLVPGGVLRPGIKIEPDVIEAAATRRDRVNTASHVNRAAAHVGLSIGSNTNPKALAKLIAEVGDIPDWFGLPLYDYQRAGAIAIAAGHSLNADEPGAGKTRTCLAAAATIGARRTVVLSPSKVITAWCRETTESGLHNHGGAIDGQVMAIVSGRKQPPLPDAGVVVVTDSLLASRPALLEELRAWAPDALIYDEAHRAKTWTSARAQAGRYLAESTRLRCLATGTPMGSSPVELATLLEITGHLTPVFGGQSAFMERYCRKNHFNAWVPRHDRLEELSGLLNEHVWVRRLKADILPHLPKKSRRPQFVDVDLKSFNRAHSEVLDKVTIWLDEVAAETGHRIDMDDAGDAEIVAEWARGQIGLMSPLRVAAGLAKIPAATEHVAEWVAANARRAADGTWTSENPLVLWAHHQEVAAALVEAAIKAAGDHKAVGAILGGTSQKAVDAAIDSYQAGTLPILVCSLTAAGVGITLTRGCNATFVETSYVVAEIAQAEDRQSRIGQTRPVVSTTMIAPGTLDERIQAVLGRKAKVLELVLPGGDNDVTVLDADQELEGPSEIIAGLVREAIARSKKHAPAKRGAARAA